MKHSPQMGFLEKKPLYLHLLTFICLTGFGFLCSSNAAPDITSLVYKGCANQTFSDQNGVYSKALSSLFDSLISQSSKLKFFKTSSGGGGQSSFSGLFQCRGDLSNVDCYSCVSKLPQMSDQLCGKTIASRIQLYGCYILYELSGFPQISGVEMLYKSCGASQAQGSGFEMRRDTALAAIESGIVSGSNGFYATKYESVYALAQCQGDLSTSDCGECVKTVVQKAQVECGSSISGQIYLQKCYMSYSYYPNGIISKTTSPVQNTGKTIAIVVGGTAGVGFGIICLMFLRSLLKKHDDSTLKLLSGSCYLPHPDKEETGGEDAHFICQDEQAIGVADGVGGWADSGIDSGLYARELMSNSVDAIQEEPKGSIDPVRVLEKAHSSTKAKGSSTACIIALTEQALNAINIGDSGFVVIRDGHTVFRSPVQQHDFNFPYQLESGNDGDLPSSGQVFTIPVAPGDVIVAGTDGLFDNLYNNEITAVVVHAVRAGLGPQVMAQKIAALARQRAQDQNRQTPFSTAAQDYSQKKKKTAAQDVINRNYGGKLDDITVVVSYITTSKL